MKNMKSLELDRGRGSMAFYFSMKVKVVRSISRARAPIVEIVDC